MNDKYYKWILNCVHDYFFFKSREFESKDLGLKLRILKNTKDDYYIEFRIGEKISILTGGEQLTKGQMIDLLEHSFIKDFKNPKTVDFDKVYNFINKCVYSLDGTYRQSFQDKDLDIKIQIYTHALSSESFDYWIKENGKSEKIYLNTNCKLAEDLIDKIYSSYINDFLTYEPFLNDPMLYVGHLNNRNHTLQLQSEDKDRQIDKLQEKVSDLKRINESIIIDNNNKTKENYELRSELKRLIADLQEEKMNHIKTKARIVFGQHILSGNREDKVKEFWNHNKEYVDDYGI